MNNEQQKNQISSTSFENGQTQQMHNGFQTQQAPSLVPPSSSYFFNNTAPSEGSSSLNNDYLSKESDSNKIENTLPPSQTFLQQQVPQIPPKPPEPYFQHRTDMTASPPPSTAPLENTTILPKAPSPLDSPSTSPQSSRPPAPPLMREVASNITSPGLPQKPSAPQYVAYFPEQTSSQEMTKLPPKTLLENAAITTAIGNEEKLAPLQKTIPTTQGLVEDYAEKVVIKGQNFSQQQSESHTITTAQESDEYDRFLKKAEENGTPPVLFERMEKIVKKIRQLEKNNTGFDVIEIERHYLEWLSLLPWNKETVDRYDLKEAQRLLDENQYGMQVIKDRILEFLAVQQMTHGEAHAPVLCFLGTPGIGKTTLSRAIAKALGRKFIRISMAAMGDVTQIKGMSHTRPSAEPGQIIKQICKAGVRNPVILFDEFEKMEGGIAGGTMMSTFLEILDPEQNYAFVDHYIDYPFDISHCILLATANKVSEGQGPVINRMELITIPDYTREEKKIIGQRFVLPSILKNTNMTPENGYHVEITDEAWDKILDPFKWDSGMRTIQHNIAGMVNKMARQAIETGQKTFIVTPQNLKEYILV